MKKWLTVSVMVIGIVLLPSSLRAPSTAGQVIVQTPSSQLQLSPSTIDTTVRTVGTISTELKLRVPFDTESRWASGSDEPLARRGNGDESLSGIWWNTNAGEKYFAIEDGQFVSNDPTDTWFIYGWFGPLNAIREDYNIKYPEWQDRHNGIDFAGRAGLEVISASDGAVIFAGNKIGNTAVVKTGDYQITYGHLQDVSVKIGQRITTGDLIGHLGNTGTVNPHLHFEVDYINGKTRLAINPVPLTNTNWNRVITPNAPSNSFYAGPADPALQSNFAW